jgi:hypothetical protein
VYCHRGFFSLATLALTYFAFCLFFVFFVFSFLVDISTLKSQRAPSFLFSFVFLDPKIILFLLYRLPPELVQNLSALHYKSIYFCFLNFYLTPLLQDMEPALEQTDMERPECVICLERLPVTAGSTIKRPVGDSDDSVVRLDSAGDPVNVPITVIGGTVATADDKCSVLAEVSSISGCSHIYHDKCIKEWSLVTNSKYLLNSLLDLIFLDPLFQLIIFIIFYFILWSFFFFCMLGYTRTLVLTCLF